MKERPIIFSIEMVKAILDGRKTMTRRVIKPTPYWEELIGGWLWIRGSYWQKTHGMAQFNSSHEGTKLMARLCPYGQVGDRLWVRETWAYGFTDQHPERIIYKADNTPLPTALERGTYSASAGFGKWAPSIHMFRKDSRLTLEITEVRVERLQEIQKSNEHNKSSDIYAEGVDYMPPYSVGVFGYNIYTTFMMYWDSLNAKRGYGWETNPWVWVIKFDNIGERVK